MTPSSASFCRAWWITPSHGSSIGVAKAPKTLTLAAAADDPVPDGVLAAGVGDPVFPPQAARATAVAPARSESAARRVNGRAKDMRTSNDWVPRGAVWVHWTGGVT